METGSAVTILYKDLWEQSAGSICGSLEAISSPVTVANGQPLHVLGLGTVRICIADVEFVHQVLIADDVSQSCALGADFLVPQRVVIDFKTNQLQVGEAAVPIHHSAMKHYQSKCVGCLSLLQLSFEEGKTNCCWATVHHTRNVGVHYPGVLEPKEGFEAQYQLLVARVVALPDNDQMSVRMANLIPVPITPYQELEALVSDFRDTSPGLGKT